MRIQMLINVTDRSGAYKRGELRDLPEDVALALVLRGRAIAVKESGAALESPEEPAAEPVSTNTEGSPAEPVSTETEGGPAELEAAALESPEETAAEPAPRRRRRGE